MVPEKNNTRLMEDQFYPELSNGDIRLQGGREELQWVMIKFCIFLFVGHTISQGLFYCRFIIMCKLLNIVD
jgi:hypothetical protein